VSTAAAQPPLAGSGVRLPGWARRHPGYLLVGACLALGFLSLALPSTPTYDPWSWILWGREVLHGDLVTESGPSWKPLPVLFTVPFSLFGDAAPYLWSPSRELAACWRSRSRAGSRGASRAAA
jgi:hypothetical protein